MSQDTQAAGAAPKPETVEVEDLNQFVALLTGWHTNQVAAIRHMLSLPEGATFAVDDKELVMVGDTLKGFKLGLEMALMQVGTLPFAVETEDDAAQQPAG